MIRVRLIDCLIRGYIDQSAYDDYIARGVKNSDSVEIPFPVVPQADYSQAPISVLSQGMNSLITPSSGKSLRVVRIYLWTFKNWAATKENARIKLFLGDRPQTGELPVEMNPFNIDFLWWPMCGQPNESLKAYLNEEILSVEGFVVYYEI